MQRAYVTRLFDQSLEQTRTLVQPVACADCATLSGGKHPAWILGHLAVGADFASQLCARPRTDGPMDERFTPGSTPRAERNAYPTKAELLDWLASAHAHARQAFLDASDETLEALFPMEEYRSFFPKVGDGVTYLLAHHEPYHNGQLQQWTLAMGHATGRSGGA
ncbi:MAG: DinB family protein [Phycisphaerales bacterium JB059]